MADLAASPSPTAPGPPPPKLGYRPALDGLRALAVTLVVITHATYLLVPEWGGRWLPGGFIGVDVFFVLSGFLITSLLLQEHHARGRISIKNFYRRRALRLLPALGALLAVHAALAVVTRADLPREGGSVVAVGLYVSNWVIASGHSLAVGLGHLWSLAVEEQFYLLWPLCIVAVLRVRRPAPVLVGIALAGIVCATSVRALLWSHGAGWEAVYVRTDARADALLIGALLALAFRRGWRLSARWLQLGPLGLAVILACAIAVPRDSGWLYVGGGFTIVALASAAIIASVLEPGPWLHHALSTPPAVQLGKASYSLYLWHVPVFSAVATALAGRPAYQRLVVGMVGTAVATLCSYRFVEMPVARLRRKARAAVEAPAPAAAGVSGLVPPVAGV